MTYVIYASQRGMGGKRMTVGPFENREIAEQAMANIASQSVGNQHDVWDRISLKEVKDEKD